MLVLRAWVLYWRVRYGFRANVTGGTFIEQAVTVGWSSPKNQRTEVAGDLFSVLRLMPGLTRLVREGVARNADPTC